VNYRVEFNKESLKGIIKVPASKSIANRLLIIQALCKEKFNIYNLSDSEDTVVLQRGLSSTSDIIDIGHAGTSMRFLTSYFSSQPCNKMLTGSARMKERPIGNLVEALQCLGADIEYTEKIGYPPLQIKGKQLVGKRIAIDGSISSQFISALLMVGSTFKGGLELELEKNVISSSYIEMTISIMKLAGVLVRKQDNLLIVPEATYKMDDFTVEGDWSGVSYWYQIAALARKSEIAITSLHKESLQGDARCVEVFKHIGIDTAYNKEGITLSKSTEIPAHFEFDFIENPDIVQTLAVTCVMLGISFKFTGTQSLRIKETDRISALQNELSKFGATLNYTDNGTLSWDGKRTSLDAIKEPIRIPTYHDHRMAMAFAPIALMGIPVIIENADVVRKSYPAFWTDLKVVGFTLTECE
jgi:3-phosphoshikimate 1-carboxyvinyltransferase